MLTEENQEFLSQLASSLEKAEAKIENIYQSKSYEDFNKLKKFILSVQKKIEEIIG